MSSLVALQLAQHRAERLTHTVVMTPPPPTGFGADESTLRSTQTLALAEHAVRRAWLEQRFSARFAPGFAAHKAARWRDTSEPSAVSAYAAMFARDGLPEPDRRIPGPLLAITGEQDFEPMRRAAVTRFLSPLCDRLTVQSFADVGHYPMQEMPPLFVTCIERFLRST